jgi:adenylate cyclase
LNLYLAGAAQALTERGGYSDKVKHDRLHKALEQSGTHAAVADAFNERLDTATNRPRFRNLVEAGKAAMTAKVEENTSAELTPLPDLITQWADPTVRGAEVKKVTFLLTDIVGSTALTSRLGNSAAQRVVRAHNAAARNAAKNFRGTEVKHTGDGMLLTFPDPAAACRAAMEIQQEGTAYARDNPDAPLVMRLGVHTGETSFEEGEYYGPTLQILNGVCAAAGDNQIFCSEDAKAKAVGPVFKFEDMGKRTLKGSGLEAKVFKLNWTPKAKPQGPVEYTQIGRKSPAGAI